MSVRLNQRRNFSHALKSTNRRVGKPANRTNQRWMRAIWIYLVRLNDHRTHLITHSFDWFLLPPPPSCFFVCLVAICCVFGSRVSDWEELGMKNHTHSEKAREKWLLLLFDWWDMNEKYDTKITNGKVSSVWFTGFVVDIATHAAGRRCTIKARKSFSRA